MKIPSIHVLAHHNAVKTDVPHLAGMEGSAVFGIRARCKESVCRSVLHHWADPLMPLLGMVEAVGLHFLACKHFFYRAQGKTLREFDRTDDKADRIMA
ncbi:hypothetical protein ACT8ZS_19390 [Paenibacillus sp. M.A.Huq-84]